MTTYTISLTITQINDLKKLLLKRSWEFAEQQYTYWQAKKEKNIIIAFKSGKLLIQGKKTVEIVQFLIEPFITKEFKLNLTDNNGAVVNSTEQLLPHCGIDESGKGDYFGSLVIACVYTEERTARELVKLGVCDSKIIKSDQKIFELANKIKKVVGVNHYDVLKLDPTKYNELYNKINNLNTLLGWGHSRVLENILIKVPNCKLAISDKFSKTGSVDKALLERGKKIQLIQRTKAENDIAVAAASILSREQFLLSLRNLSKIYSIDLPKGTSKKTIVVGKQFIQKKGVDSLSKVAKIHFKTTQIICQ